MVLFLENVFSALIMRFIWQKKTENFEQKIRKYDEKKCFFEEKTFSSFKIASLPNCEGVKYAGGSRPAVLSINQSRR